MNCRHVLTLVVACFEVLLGNVVDGFPFLVFALQDEGYFSEVCSTDDVTNFTQRIAQNGNTTHATKIGISKTPQHYVICSKQEEVLSLIYSISSFVLLAGFFTDGLIVRKYGWRISKLIGITLYLAGCLLIATSSKENGWVLYPATTLLAAGSSLFYLCSVQHVDLFPKIRSTLVAVLIGMYGSATIVCWLVTVAHRSGISFRYSFYLLSSWSVISLLSTFFLSPREHVPLNADENKCTAPHPTDTDERSTFMRDRENDTVKGNPTIKHILAAMRNCIKTRIYISATLQVCILGYRNLFFIGTFPTWIRTFGSDDEFASYVDAFAIFTLLSGFVSPVIGIIADHLISRYRKLKMPNELCQTKAHTVCGFIVSGVAVVFTISVAIPVLPLQYFSFFCYILSRSSSYSYLAICLTDRFPITLFGVLYGLSSLLIGLLSLLIQPMLSWVLNDHNGNFLYVQIVFLCIILISFVHPFGLYSEYRKKARVFCQQEATAIQNERTTI